MSGIVPVGFVGTGNMAGAIIGGITGKKIFAPGQIGVFDVNREALAEYTQRGHVAFESAEQLVAGCKTIVLAIKPQVFDVVLPQIAKSMAPEKVLVSIAAGISAERIKKAVGFDCKVVLVMPNTPLLIGYGATALCRVEPASEEEFAFVKRIFETAGIAEEVDCSLMKQVIPVNGSSPALVYLLAKLMADNAGRVGINREAADRLFLQTLIGSAQMMLQSGKTQQELIDMVCSPGGTTLAGLAALREQGFEQAVAAYYNACIRRAEELSGE